MPKQPHEYTDYPFDEVVKKAKELCNTGSQVFQKFTCEKCGTRLTIDTPNVFHRTGTCDQCNHITNIEANGCNFTVIFGPPIDFNFGGKQ